LGEGGRGDEANMGEGWLLGMRPEQNKGLVGMRLKQGKDII